MLFRYGLSHFSGRYHKGGSLACICRSDMSTSSPQPREGNTVSSSSRYDNTIPRQPLFRYICEHIMSFGYSVGDFLALYNLVNTVRKQFVEAPEQFRAISDE